VATWEWYTAHDAGRSPYLALFVLRHGDLIAVLRRLLYNSLYLRRCFSLELSDQQAWLCNAGARARDIVGIFKLGTTTEGLRTGHASNDIVRRALYELRDELPGIKFSLGRIRIV